MSQTVAVEDLRIGMYIHLEGGWLSHPFPLSSFRIASNEQLKTLRGLGLKRVRWYPEKSDRVDAGAGANPASVGKGAAVTGSDVAADELVAATDAIDASDAPAAGSPGPNTVAAALAAPSERAEQRRQAWLAAQREAAQRCESQFAEAGQAWRSAYDAVAAKPHQAGQQALALTQGMLDKMLGAEDVGIRLVSGSGDRAAAHALNVAVISMLLGRTLGLADTDMLDLGTGALLHDVGKQDLPERFRHAEDGFGPAELNTYRDHVAKGMAQGQRMKLSAGAMSVLAQHHEHADGSGFPLRLNGDRMSMAARIVAIVNRYDNLCNPATRAAALTPHEAVAMLFAHGRARYDATVLNAFIRMMGVYPAGSLVQLTDDRYALVVGGNSSRPLKPRVLVHDTGSRPAGRGTPATSANDARLIDLEHVPDLGIRRSLSAMKLPAQALAALDPRPRVSYYFEALESRSGSRSEGDTEHGTDTGFDAAGEELAA